MPEDLVTVRFQGRIGDGRRVHLGTVAAGRAEVSSARVVQTSVSAGYVCHYRARPIGLSAFQVEAQVCGRSSVPYQLTLTVAVQYDFAGGFATRTTGGFEADAGPIREEVLELQLTFGPDDDDTARTRVQEDVGGRVVACAVDRAAGSNLQVSVEPVGARGVRLHGDWIDAPEPGIPADVRAQVLFRPTA